MLSSAQDRVRDYILKTTEPTPTPKAQDQASTAASSTQTASPPTQEHQTQTTTTNTADLQELDPQPISTTESKSEASSVHESEPDKMTDVEQQIKEQTSGEGKDVKPQEDPATKTKEGEVDTSPLTGEETNAQVANRLSALIDQAIDRCRPLLEMMNEHLSKAEHLQKHDPDNFDEEELVKQVKPLIEQATNILRETQGGIKAMDPDGTIAANAQRKNQDHEASKEEHHLAESLATLTGEVTKTIEKAKDTIKDMPHAKDKLGPLLNVLQDPLFQIVSGVGLLLNGVLSLLGRLLDGLGLGGIVRNLLQGLGLDKVLKSMGLTGLFKK